MPSAFETINLVGGPLDGKHDVFNGTTRQSHRLIAYNSTTGWSGEAYSDDADWTGKFNMGDLIVLEYVSDEKRPWFRARRYEYVGAFERVVTRCDVHRQHVSRGLPITIIRDPQCSRVALSIEERH